MLAKARPILFQSAGDIDMRQDVGVESTADKTEKPMDDVNKSRLLTDMSVPLDCDKGERMMRLMGWQGGALGLRGEGITEPIIPALHIAPGAGLGHIKQVQTALNTRGFRWKFLNSILSFIRAEENETTLECTERLSKAKMRFVKGIIQNLKGISGGYKRPREKKIFDKLVKEMRKQGKQVEGHVSSPGHKKIKLTKVPLMVRKPKKLDSTSNNRDARLLCKPIRTVIQNTDSPDDCITEIITENEVMILSECGNNLKLTFKLIYLKIIHDFLQRGYEKRRYEFEHWKKMTKTLKSYISTVIMAVNKKRVPRLKTDLENIIYGNIKKATPPGCYFTVLVEDRNFTLQKKLKTKSARDISPPKSTDLKNTIIYQNNEIVSYNGVIKDDNDDGDVILKEKKLMTKLARDISPQKSTDLKNTIISQNNEIVSYNGVIKDDNNDGDIILKEKKLKTNSARDLSPPKSTELKNTIIYQNNKIIRYNGVIKDDNDYNDVILIEKKLKTKSARDLSPPKSTDLKNTIINQNNKIVSYNGVIKDDNNDSDIILIEKKLNTNSARDLSPPKSTDLKNTIIYQNNKIVSYNGVIKDDNDDVILIEKKLKTKSAGDLSPPKSTDLKNTITYQNNKIISYNSVIKDDNDDDDIILIEKKIDVFEISDDEDNEMKVDSETVGTACTDNSGNTVEKFTHSLDVISIESSQDLNTSCETLLLETVEEDFKVKLDLVDMELEKDIKDNTILDYGFLCAEDVIEIFDVKQELETPEDNCKDIGTEIVELQLVSDIVQPKKESVDSNVWCLNVKPTTYKSLYVLQTLNDISDTTTEVKNEDPTGVKNECHSFLHLTTEENVKKLTENIINAGTINKSTENSQLRAEDDHSKKDSFDEIQNRLDTNKEDSNESIEATDMNKEYPTEIPDSVQKSKDDKCINVTETDSFEFYEEKSPGVGKRSRSSTLNSETKSVSKKIKTEIRSVRITCKEPDEDLNLKTIRKVQSVISESIDIIIDNVDFLPRLECHGVKNGGLIYSCHDDKTFAWLTNFVLSDLDVNVTETDYNLNKSFMMEIKIFNFEDVDKILNRIKLYNPELDTSLWRVKDRKEFEDFVVITVELDRESFERIHENNNSLFAGADKAKFNIVWS